uniref:Uncharacterized protein n=1 Tax=Caenorhabditis japonica TaxID=281687 RepID=A0A8R1IEG6_CAEJA
MRLKLSTVILIAAISIFFNLVDSFEQRSDCVESCAHLDTSQEFGDCLNKCSRRPRKDLLGDSQCTCFNFLI